MNPEDLAQDRAKTKKAKRRIIKRLLHAWLRSEHERLGQLVANVVGPSDPFFVEDEELFRALERRLDLECVWFVKDDPRGHDYYGPEDWSPRWEAVPFDNLKRAREVARQVGGVVVRVTRSKK